MEKMNRMQWQRCWLAWCIGVGYCDHMSPSPYPWEIMAPFQGHLFRTFWDKNYALIVHCTLYSVAVKKDWKSRFIFCFSDPETKTKNKWQFLLSVPQFQFCVTQMHFKTALRGLYMWTLVICVIRKHASHGVKENFKCVFFCVKTCDWSNYKLFNSAN